MAEQGPEAPDLPFRTDGWADDLHEGFIVTCVEHDVDEDEDFRFEIGSGGPELAYPCGEALTGPTCPTCVAIHVDYCTSCEHAIRSAFDW